MIIEMMHRCSGYEGKCYSPNAIEGKLGNLPRSEFTPDGIRGHCCRSCRNENNRINGPNSEARNKILAAMGYGYGSVWWKRASKTERKTVRKMAYFYHQNGKTPAEISGSGPQMSFMEAVAINHKAEGPGFVYIYRDTWWKFGYLKIGYETEVGHRLADFRTSGDYVLVHRQHFEFKRAAEKAVHVELEYCRVPTHKEVFNCSQEVAIAAIEKVALSYREAA